VEGRDGVILDNLIKASVLTVFKERFDVTSLREVITAFDEPETIAHTGEDVAVSDTAALLDKVPVLRVPVGSLTADESPAAVAAAIEFILEGLHLSKRLNKDSAGNRSTYRSRS
jgi:magnesium chelatase subunit I